MTEETPNLKKRIRAPLLLDREAAILEALEGRAEIAHLGCTDWPYTAHRIDEGRLFHAKLLRAFPQAVGVDIDAGGAETLRRALPGSRYLVTDITSDLPDEASEAFDAVVAGEVLEHVDDAGGFLRATRRMLRPGGILIVTVPSACSPKIGLRTLLGREDVHPDHRTYYGPRTIERALLTAGFGAVSVSTYLSTPSRKGQLANGLLRGVHAVNRGPVGDGLFALARL